MCKLIIIILVIFSLIGLSSSSAVETQQSYFSKQGYCTATFKGTVRKGEITPVFDVVNERGGGMVRYKVDEHKNPTWLYAESFNGLNCQ